MKSAKPEVFETFGGVLVKAVRAAAATGVAFSRNPATGDNKFYGEWLINAQGEDVVAGIRTPNPLNEATKNPHNASLESLEKAMPEVYKERREDRG